MTYNENNKKAIYKWREKNIDIFRAYNALQQRKFYGNNKEVINKRNLDKYYFKKEFQRLSNILLE